MSAEAPKAPEAPAQPATPTTASAPYDSRQVLNEPPAWRTAQQPMTVVVPAPTNTVVHSDNGFGGAMAVALVWIATILTIGLVILAIWFGVMLVRGERPNFWVVPYYVSQCQPPADNCPPASPAPAPKCPKKHRTQVASHTSERSSGGSSHTTTHRKKHREPPPQHTVAKAKANTSPITTLNDPGNPFTQTPHK